MGMCWGTKLQVHPQVLAKFSEFVIVELPPIICNDSVGDPVSADDILPNEIHCLFLCDLAEDSHLYPFSEVINSHNCMRCGSSALG